MLGNFLLKEEKITISTNKADVVFTTLGGDIVSYKLKDHEDTDTNEGIQLSDSINDFNRTCAISLGGADSMIIDKVFSYEKIDDFLTILIKFSPTDEKNLYFIKYFSNTFKKTIAFFSHLVYNSRVR